MDDQGSSEAREKATRQERDVDSGFGADSLIGGPPRIRLGDPNAPRSADGFDTSTGLRPGMGNARLSGRPEHRRLADPGPGSRPRATRRTWRSSANGFQISGEIRTGQFERISDWLNMQTGFIQVRDAWHVHLGQTEAPAPDQREEHAVGPAQPGGARRGARARPGRRPGAPVIQKQQRTVSVVTPGYRIVGKMHIVTYGSMAQFLETPDPHFLPITDVTVHWLSDPAMVGRYPFAMINRDQLVTLIDELSSSGGDAARSGPRVRGRAAGPQVRRRLTGCPPTDPFVVASAPRYPPRQRAG